MNYTQAYKLLRAYGFTADNSHAILEDSYAGKPRSVRLSGIENTLTWSEEDGFTLHSYYREMMQAFMNQVESGNGRFELVEIGEINGAPVTALFEDMASGRYVRMRLSEEEYHEDDEDE